MSINRPLPKPEEKPANPKFSSGPTSKRPGWSLAEFNTESLGRSHRAKQPKSRLKKVIDDSKRILGIPEDYLLAIVPASDTGAFEMAMWTMLGARGVDVLSWESFGEGWATDIKSQLKLHDIRLFSAPYGDLPDLNSTDAASRDVIFTWNGTTSGVCLSNADWISADREGLTFCDATSAVFAMEVDWSKLDVVTWSWQKVLGGEAGHGMLALSPRALERLETYTPVWPLPKIFRLSKKGKVGLDLFAGSTINTPSMLAVEDQLDALAWAGSIGGLGGLVERSQANLSAIKTWVDKSDWIAFLASDPSTISSTSICLCIVDEWFSAQGEDAQRSLIKSLVSKLEAEDVALDIGGYRDAPPGLRIWGGGTIEVSDIEALLPWLDWAYSQIRG
jgi:phosphoserine aminotransferase